jgi:glutamate synthase domain-containing protein 2
MCLLEIWSTVAGDSKSREVGELLNSLLMSILNPLSDETVKRLLTDEYPFNLFLMGTIAEKLTVRGIVEACLRAETGKALARPMGSPVVLSPWEKLLLNPRQLFQLPTDSIASIDTTTVIGHKARRPLQLDIPIMITGMSYGGSLSLRTKMALAKGSAMVGTSTNTGESTVTNEVRDLAKYLVGQYNRGGWLTSHESLSRLDAIEVQLGQGAFGGAVESYIQGSKIDDHLRKAWHVEKGHDATVRSRMPGVSTPEDIVALVNNLKREYEVPVGVKIAGTDFIEQEIEVFAETDADFIVVDGAEGGTAAAPPTLEDDLGLPTLHTLVRTVDALEEAGIRDEVSVIAGGGLKTPGHFLKAMALGADAVYIGSIAVEALLQSQVIHVLPNEPPTQMVLYDGKYTDKLDINKSAQYLANFLTSCVEEMKLAAQAMGKNSLKEITRDDLVAVDKDLAEFIGIRYAGSHRPVRQPAMV